MRGLTKGLATLAAHIYVFIVKYKFLCVTAGLLLLACSPAVMTEGRRLLKVQAAKEIILVNMEHINHAEVDYLGDWIYVMVDAGHGGKDPGASHGDIYEKDITLSVARRVADLLEGHKVKVIMTREDDIFIDKYDRARMANDEQVDIFVSIHVNDLKQKSHSGIETYAGHMKRSGWLLAQSIHEETVDTVKANDLGIHTANYVVVRWTRMPAALIEIGYMSNEEERTKLQSQAYQQMVAEGIVEGILEFAEKQLGLEEP